MIKLTEENLWTDEYNGQTIESYHYKDIDRICLLVDDEPYLIADMNGGILRMFVDWVDRMDLVTKKKIIGARKNKSWMIPYEMYFETTGDESKLIRLMRKLSKHPNGRVIL